MISLVSGRRVLFTGVGVLCNVDSLADMVSTVVVTEPYVEILKWDVFFIR